jgi:hypothetical protein
VSCIVQKECTGTLCNLELIVFSLEQLNIFLIHFTLSLLIFLSLLPTRDTQYLSLIVSMWKSFILSTWIILLVPNSWKEWCYCFWSLFSKVLFWFPLRYMHINKVSGLVSPALWSVAFISYLFQQFLNPIGLLLYKHDVSISRLSDFSCRPSKIHLKSTPYIPLKYQAYLCEVALGSRLQPPHSMIEVIVCLGEC